MTDNFDAALAKYVSVSIAQHEWDSVAPVGMTARQRAKEQKLHKATDDAYVELIAALQPTEAGAKPVAPKDNDAIWAAYYRDGLTLGQVAEKFGLGVYDLSPWLYQPLMRMPAPTPPTDNTALVKALEDIYQNVDRWNSLQISSRIRAALHSIEAKPFKMAVSNSVLKQMIESDPDDAECEAGYFVTPPTDNPAQPVAWQARWKDGGLANLVVTKPEHSHPELKWEPLYAAPPTDNPALAEVHEKLELWRIGGADVGNIYDLLIQLRDAIVDRNPPPK